MMDEQEIMKQKEKRKKVLFIAVSVIVGIFIVFGLTVLILSGVKNYLQDKRKAEYDSKMNKSYVYPPADYDLNIFDDSGYMGLDRNVWFNDGAAKTVITDDNLKNYSPELQFMYNVINLIINGDYTEYNKIFTDDYIRTAGENLRDRFTMQQLYNIELEIEDYSQTNTASGLITQSVIVVNYMIRNNNGTFRNDLDYNEEAIREVVYMLTTTESGIKVTNYMPLSKYEAGLY